MKRSPEPCVPGGAGAAFIIPGVRLSTDARESRRLGWWHVGVVGAALLGACHTDTAGLEKRAPGAQPDEGSGGSALGPAGTAPNGAATNPVPEQTSPTQQSG